MSKRSHVEQRFGPVVAAWYSRVVCACLLVMLFAFLTVSVGLLLGENQLGRIPGIGALAAGLGIVFCLRMFRAAVSDQ